MQDDGIVFGLGAIKNAGEEAIREIVSARDKKGPFSSFLDLCRRVNLRKVTQRVLEFLIKAGACDCFGASRAGLLAALGETVRRAQKQNGQAASRGGEQLALFTVRPESGIGYACPEQTLGEALPEICMEYEQESLGMRLTTHPLFAYQSEIRRLGLGTLRESHDLSPGTSFSCAALLAGYREFIDGRGDPWAVLTLEDLSGTCDCLCFAKPYGQYKTLLHSGEALLLSCNIMRPGKKNNGNEEEKERDRNADFYERENACACVRVTPLAEACAEHATPVVLFLREENNCDGRLARLTSALARHRGHVPLQAMLYLNGVWVCMEFGPEYAVLPSAELFRDIAEWLH